ncbi:MAG: phosphoglycerate dehydrogenase [Spirochaetales bacterium]|jgi:D-3-phosphoglycerate dehydrogenase|nr:phosphoglycerate dehydrogenase [Spirochaetales bacterium]
MKKIVICHIDYTAYCKEGADHLAKSGFEITANPHGRMYTREELCGDIADADAVIADTELWDEAAFAAAKKLKCLIRFGTGMDNVNLEAARRHGVIVANTPGYNANAVSEQTIALLFNLVRAIPQLDTDTRKGKWPRTIFYEMSGKFFGILGFGIIGRKSAKKLSGLGGTILAYDKYPDMKAAGDLNVTISTLDEVLLRSDYILIHLPLLPETRHIICTRTIARMKDGVYIVNTGRGPLVKEQDVADALKSGKIAGFASDVFEVEPPSPINPLFGCRNYICSPHIAGSTYQNMKETGLAAAISVTQIFEGKDPCNRLA